MKLSQRQLARLCGITHGFLGLLEVGRKGGSVRTLAALSRELHLDMGKLAALPVCEHKEAS